MKIYGFLGRKRSGKDTAAKIVDDTTDADTKVKYMSFAEPMKDALIELTGAKREYFYDQEFKEQPVIVFGDRKFTPRELMTWYGGLMREKFGSNFWSDKVKERIAKENVDYLLITDVRFLEEAKMIDELGGTIVYMNRDVILGPLPKDADVSEKVVYDSAKWAKQNAKHFVEISNHNESIGYLTMSLRYSLNI